MSYCRFSSDDFQCDVYVYESCEGGFMTHIAGTRYIFREPLPDPVPFAPPDLDRWLDRHRKVSEMVEAADRSPIDLPEAGTTVWDSTAEECAATLVRLREAGFRVPQYAIDALLEEAAESGD